MWFGKGVVVRGRERGGGETAGPWPSGASPPSAVTTPLAHSDSLRRLLEILPLQELLPPTARGRDLFRPWAARPAKAAPLPVSRSSVHRGACCCCSRHLSCPLLSPPASCPPTLSLSPRAQTPPTSCSLHVLRACHCLLALLRRCQPLDHLAGLCPGTCVGTVPSHPPCPQGGLLYLRASSVWLRPRHASPCTRLELTLPFYSTAPPPAMHPGLRLAFLALLAS